MRDSACPNVLTNHQVPFNAFLIGVAEVFLAVLFKPWIGLGEVIFARLSWKMVVVFCVIFASIILLAALAGPAVAGAALASSSSSSSGSSRGGYGY